MSEETRDPSDRTAPNAARPYIGGQAVIEGVMMRSPGSLSIVCRRRSGELVVRERSMAAPPKGARSWPLVRGVVTVVDALRTGSRALRWSASLYEEDMEAAEGGGPPPKDAADKAKKSAGVATMLALGVVTLL